MCSSENHLKWIRWKKEDGLERMSDEALAVNQLSWEIAVRT